MSVEPFWKTTALSDMTDAQWEALCDGCGRCCLQKLRDEDTDQLAFTNVACHMLDRQSCACSDYPNRQKHVSDCIALTPKILAEIDWLPPSCAYRLLAEGQDLFWWHPLNSGTSETVHSSGASVRGRVISEHDAGPWETHIRAWPGEMPRPRRPKRPARPAAPTSTHTTACRKETLP